MMKENQISKSELESIRAYRKFISSYGKPGLVVYPCCGFDFSPSEVFDNVVYIDRNKEVTDYLKRKSLEVFNSEVRDFSVSEKVDLALIINPEIQAGEITRVLNPEFVICNNLHGSFEQMKQLGNYELLKRLESGFYLFKKIG